MLRSLFGGVGFVVFILLSFALALIPDSRVRVPLFFTWVTLVTYVLNRDERRKERERWAQTGHCWKCGYDFRATPDRCPGAGRK